MGSGTQPASSPLGNGAGNPKTAFNWRSWFLKRPSFLELLAIIAALVTIYYDHDIRQQMETQSHTLNEQFTVQKSKIEEIVADVSTGYLPDWPEHMEQLTNLVKAVEKGDELAIRVDSLGYLSFTQPDKFRDFFNELLAVAHRNDVNVRILTLDEKHSRAAGDVQFGPGKGNAFTGLDPKQIEKYVQANRKQIEQTPFGRKYQPGYDPKKHPEDLEDFLDAIMFVEDHYCQQLTLAGVTVRTIPEFEGSYLWLRHKELRHKDQVWHEMIFAYPRFRGIQKGYAFRTRDSHLMEIFLFQFNKQFDNALTRAVKERDHIYPDLLKTIKLGSD